jgi:hypothetical protein
MNLYSINGSDLNKHLEDRIIEYNGIIQTISEQKMEHDVSEIRYIGTDFTIITKKNKTLILPNKNLNESYGQGHNYFINKLFKQYYNSRRCDNYRHTIYYENSLTGKIDYKIIELYQTTYTSAGINMVFKLKNQNSLHQSNMEIDYNSIIYTYIFPDYMKEIKGVHMAHIIKNIDECPLKTSQEAFQIVQKIEKYKENKMYFEVNGLLRNIIHFYKKALSDPLNRYDNKLKNQRDYIIRFKKKYDYLIPSTRVLRYILTITYIRGELPYLPQEILENITYFV